MAAGHGLFDFGVNISVGDEQVEPAVIVVVDELDEKARSKSRIYVAPLKAQGSNT
jgi:hypothetical protein